MSRMSALVPTVWISAILFQLVKSELQMYSTILLHSQNEVMDTIK